MIAIAKRAVDDGSFCYHLYPQLLHLKVFPIFPEISPSMAIENPRSRPSILRTLVEPQVGQCGDGDCLLARQVKPRHGLYSVNYHLRYTHAHTVRIGTQYRAFTLWHCRANIIVIVAIIFGLVAVPVALILSHFSPSLFTAYALRTVAALWYILQCISLSKSVVSYICAFN